MGQCIGSHIHGKLSQVCEPGAPDGSIWQVMIYVLEDNATCIHVVVTGKDPTMKCLERYHGVSLAWLNERVRSGYYAIIHTRSHDSPRNFAKKYCSLRFYRFTPYMQSQHWVRQLCLQALVLQPCRMQQPQKRAQPRSRRRARQQHHPPQQPWQAAEDESKRPRPKESIVQQGLHPHPGPAKKKQTAAAAAAATTEPVETKEETRTTSTVRRRIAEKTKPDEKLVPLEPDSKKHRNK